MWRLISATSAVDEGKLFRALKIHVPSDTLGTVTNVQLHIDEEHDDFEDVDKKGSGSWPIQNEIAATRTELEQREQLHGCRSGDLSDGQQNVDELLALGMVVPGVFRNCTRMEKKAAAPKRTTPKYMVVVSFDPSHCFFFVTKPELGRQDDISKMVAHTMLGSGFSIFWCCRSFEKFCSSQCCRA